jgi:glycogen operon protein
MSAGLSVHERPIPQHPSAAGLLIERGSPSPLGSSVQRDGVNFAIFSRHADSMSLVLFDAARPEPEAEIPLDRRFHRTGDIWHVLVGGLGAGAEYGWRADGPSDPLTRFDPRRVLVDPYAKALRPLESRPARPGAPRSWRSIVIEDGFDWEDDRPLNRHLADTVIYELHVRGFTRDASSGSTHPGTYRGLIEKIPYLKELGVTAVELMPVAEFDEFDNARVNPLTGKPLTNFWGYHPINFFAVKGSYAAALRPIEKVYEFKSMVKACHQAGIEVILDVVFNHTGEGDDRGPTLSFRGLDNAAYYILDPRSGAYLNYTGCGNTVNCNHPIVRDMILDALRYWVTEMHVDGFRFDLASVLGRDGDGSVLSNPPVLERITMDPILANTKLIAEAWDAAGLYQLGSFCSSGRWAEWNGRFRDDVRRFVRGEPGMVPSLATRLAGSSDLFQPSGRAPFHSINFIACHDGLTLLDLTSYDRKHNEANGEGSADGLDENFGWNCGVEGPTDSPEVNALRRRQQKNFAALLFLSQGVPMLLAGDELGRTQLGNNNAYCHDDELAWIDWRLLEKNADLFRFFRLLTRFRRKYAMLRRRSFFDDNGHLSDVLWHGIRAGAPDWSHESRQLAIFLRGGGGEPDLYVMANSQWDGHTFELPPPSPGRSWHRFIDTVLQPPNDIREEGHEPLVKDPTRYRLAPRTVVVLVGR